MRDGLVVDEFGEAVTAGRPYRGHMRVYYYRALDDEPRMPFEETVLLPGRTPGGGRQAALFARHALGQLPAGDAAGAPEEQLGMDGLVPIHRIDRETAGLVLFSVNPLSAMPTRRCFAGMRSPSITKRWRHGAATSAFRLRAKAASSKTIPSSGNVKIEGEPNSETLIDVLHVKGDKALLCPQPRDGQEAPTARAHECARPATAE
jgi:tRNA pseudouridine32 synthase/23S rRNA pseudouridine746 synthase